MWYRGLSIHIDFIDSKFIFELDMANQQLQCKTKMFYSFCLHKLFVLSLINGVGLRSLGR